MITRIFYGDLELKFGNSGIESTIHYVKKNMDLGSFPRPIFPTFFK